MPAPYTKSAYKSLVDSLITTNGTNAITGAIDRGLRKDGADSFIFPEDLFTSTTGTTITLDNVGRGNFFGTNASPTTGNLTVSETGAVVGAVSWVLHNDVSQPTITGASQKNFTYNTGANNYLRFKYFEAGIVIVDTPFAADNVSVKSGSGSPESAVTAGVGTIYLRTDGGADTVIYEKINGTGNTGWVSRADLQGFVTLTDAATITWEVRNAGGTGRKKAVVTLAGNRTLSNPTGALDGDELYLIVKQDATGGRTLTWDTKFSFIGSDQIFGHAFGHDRIKVVYSGTDDTFYCQFDRPTSYSEKLLLPGASDVDLNMDSLTAAQIDGYHGRLIFQNGLSSTGGGSDLTLPQLSKLPVGFRLPILMIQGNNGGILEINVGTAADTLYLTGGDVFPYLDTSGTHKIEIPASTEIVASFDLVVRDPSGVGALKSWGIIGLNYRIIDNPSALSAGTGAVTWDALKGYRRNVTLSGNITLTMSNFSAQDESRTGILMVTHPGSGGPFDITLPSASTVPDGHTYLTESSGTYKLENLAVSDVIALSYYYDGTNFHWNATKRI